MSQRFDGRIAIVTGAAQGIGEAVASGLAAEGASVALVDINESAAQVVADRLVAQGSPAIAIGCDVRKASDVETAVATTVGKFGGLDVIVCNAGVVRYGTAPDLSEEDWDFQIDTNLKGQFLMAKYGIPVLRTRGGGAIVNVASVQAFGSQQLVVAYSASKAGVVAMTKTLALDHAAENIRVNCVAPGSVETPMLKGAAKLFRPEDPEQAVTDWGANHPLGRVIQPAEVAAVILFLASEEASSVTGSCYLVDGGLHAKLAV